MPLRVVEGASKFIEGASLYKTFTTGLSPVGKPYNRPAGEEMHFPPFGGWRHMNKPLWGLRVDGPLGRRFLRGLSLTAALPLRVVEGAFKL